MKTPTTIFLLVGICCLFLAQYPQKANAMPKKADEAEKEADLKPKKANEAQKGWTNGVKEIAKNLLYPKKKIYFASFGTPFNATAFHGDKKLKTYTELKADQKNGKFYVEIDMSDFDQFINQPKVMIEFKNAEEEWIYGGATVQVLHAVAFLDFSEEVRKYFLDGSGKLFFRNESTNQQYLVDASGDYHLVHKR
ncbi:hypothetical protein niasHS_008706 [Heterodera schachtii]|uniref:Uncharacterized protein n=1 Tax=Heterodera schachtii TaxID=97005 RepID=A0ABD2JB72_HETSC